MTQRKPPTPRRRAAQRGAQTEPARPLRFAVRIAPEAGDDIRRLYDFMLERDLSAADRMLAAIEHGLATLALTPHTCRRSLADPRLRELIIGFGHTGYVALFSIEPEGEVLVLAVRHQRESDYL